MSKNWILDVLADLRTFARENDMPILAAQLKDTEIVAMAELATLQEARASSKGMKNDTETGAVLANAGGRERHN